MAQDLGKGKLSMYLAQDLTKKEFSKWHGLGLGKGKIFHVLSLGLDHNRNFPSGMA